MWRAPQQRELQHSEQWDLSRMQPPWHCSLPQVPGVASSLPQQSPDHCQQRCSTLSPGRQRCHGENWNKSKHTALVDGYTCGNWREGQGTPPREAQRDTTARMHLQCNVLPCSLRFSISTQPCPAKLLLLAAALLPRG